jgi:hypothetical protein
MFHNQRKQCEGMVYDQVSHPWYTMFQNEKSININQLQDRH